jgi:hypothetical protein
VLDLLMQDSHKEAGTGPVAAIRLFTAEEHDAFLDLGRHINGRTRKRAQQERP